jgi:hypothetical protein
MAQKFALLGGLAAMSGLLLLAPAQPLSAAKRPVSIEKELLGIRILSSYRTVLAKYGQPTRIYRSGEVVSLVGATDANGNLTGGVLGLGDEVGNGGMPGMGGGPMGMARRGMGGGPMGMSGGSGMPMGMNRGPMGMAGGPMGMGGSGMPMGMAGGPMGMGRGMSGAPMGSGMPMGMAGRGMGGSSGALGGGLGAASGQGSETFGDSGGFQWVYFYPKQELVYWFVFNKDGRVEAILERGRYLGQKTSQGLGLGAPVKSVYNSYGWPDTIEQQGPTLALRYNVKHHVQFNVLNNKTTAIAVFLSETQRYFSDENSSGGGPGMGGRGMGGPGLAGGPGRGMRGMPGLSGAGGAKGD